MSSALFLRRLSASLGLLLAAAIGVAFWVWAVRTVLTWLASR